MLELLVAFSILLRIKAKSTAVQEAYINITVPKHFSQHGDVLEIPENVGLDTFVGLVSVIVKGQRSEESKWKWELSSDEFYRSVCVEDYEPGAWLLRLNTNLDRESKSYLKLKMTATLNQRWKGRIRASRQLTIKILDVNDNSPVFTKPVFRVTLSTVKLRGDTGDEFVNVTRVSATDADVGVNGEIVYSIINYGDLFRIDPDTGDVFYRKHALASAVRNNLLSRFDIVIVAKNRAEPKYQLPSSTILRIYIETSAIEESTKIGKRNAIHIACCLLAVTSILFGIVAMYFFVKSIGPIDGEKQRGDFCDGQRSLDNSKKSNSVSAMSISPTSSENMIADRSDHELIRRKMFKLIPSVYRLVTQPCSVDWDVHDCGKGSGFMSPRMSCGANVSAIGGHPKILDLRDQLEINERLVNIAAQNENVAVVQPCLGCVFCIDDAMIRSIEDMTNALIEAGEILLNKEKVKSNCTDRDSI